MTASAPSPILTDEEINKICEPLEQASAQIRYLRSLGLLVNRKPSGRALVARSELERVLGAARMDETIATAHAEAFGDIAALRAHWSRNGTQAQRR